MGSFQSSIKNNVDHEYFNLIGKIYVSKIELFLCQSKSNDKYYLTLSSCNFDNSGAIKLKKGAIFVIDDIITYCANEGGVVTNDIYVYFPQKLNKNIVDGIINFNKFDKKFLSQIYDIDENTLKYIKINSLTYGNDWKMYQNDNNFFVDDYDKTKLSIINKKYDRLKLYQNNVMKWMIIATIIILCLCCMQHFFTYNFNKKT